MSQRDSESLIADILEHARYAVGFIEGQSRNSLQTDIQLQFAVVHAIEVVGAPAEER